MTKTWPSSDTRILHRLGVRDVAENRQQDLERKALELPDLDLTWHFIGQIQSNKAAGIAARSDVVHSVDSVKVATRLARAAAHDGRDIRLLRPGEPRSRQAPAPDAVVLTADAVDAVAEAVASGERLRLLGVMGVAPLGGDARTAYRELAAASARLQNVHREASSISAGMSADFTTAIGAGATHVRVGSAVLGERPPLR